tara:strand:+ start:508 stop:1887 length:1380 start_codon:yes stop_codon:yes gene_type:complete
VGYYRIFDETEARDGQSFRDDSLQVEELRLGDFSSMINELSQLIKSNDNISLRPVPIVSGVTEDLARLYVKRPTRTFRGIGGPAGRALAEIYKRSKIDRALLEIHQKLVAQNSVIVEVLPSTGGRVHVASYCPFEFEVERGNLTNAEISDATRVTLRVPLQQSGDSVYFGRRVYTRELAYTELPSGDRIPVFGDDIAHNLGRLPLVGIRATDGRKGWWAPPINEALLQIAIGTTIAVSDIEHICRNQCHGRQVLTGAGARSAARSMRSGPRELWIFESDGDGNLDFDIKHTKPEVEKYLKAIEGMLEMFERFSHLTPGSLSKSSGITGAAKDRERVSVLEESERTRTLFEDFEQDLAELIAAVGPSVLAAGTVPEVDVRYHLVQAPDNTLQGAQARAIDFAQGIDSAVEYVSRAEGIQAKDAQERVVRRLEMFKDWAEKTQAQDIQGMDKTARAQGGAP